MKHGITFLALAGLAMACAANEPTAGKAKAETVCAACHGLNGVSVSDTIPNLAGQKAAYLQNQLRAWKDGSRKNALMNAIAAQLGAEDIPALAAHFAALPGAGAASAKSDLLPSLVKTGVSFPTGYPTGFTMYQTVNRPDIGQVRYLYANATALQAARDGRPLPDGAVLVLEQHAAKRGPDGKPLAGSDGFFQSERLLAHAVMARGPGWGQAIPELLRNEDWNYAVFTPAGQLRAGVNQAECLACHKPLDKTSYTFSLDALTNAARAR
ncbi:MAG: cytochrome P460 family protein [Burkholderiales bacterium]|nr:cytochrome P460 family protein [Burkholderiales bacterium]